MVYFHFQMLSGMFWRLNAGLEVNRVLRMRQRRVAVSFNTPARQIPISTRLLRDEDHADQSQEQNRD